MKVLAIVYVRKRESENGRENGKRERFLVREIGFINWVKSSYLILCKINVV